MTSLAYDDGKEHRPFTRLEAMRWLESQPGWARLSVARKEIVAYLVESEYDELAGTLTTRGRNQIAKQSGIYTADQIKHTLTALRTHGLAWAKPRFESRERGSGKHQAPSIYYLSTRGERHVVDVHRQEAAAKGRAPAVPRIGKVPFGRDDDAAVRRQLRNRTRACEACGREYLPRKPWQRFCQNACRVSSHRRLPTATHGVTHGSHPAH